MADGNTPLEILGQLAREYSHKYDALRQMSKELEPDLFLARLAQRAEIITGHFRTAQQSVLSTVPGRPEPASEAIITLCSCFDEMRMLLELALEQRYGLDQDG